MTTVSADNGTQASFALHVILLRQTYVLPWSQFLYGEGGNDEAHLAFATHDVLVKGSNLESLLAAIAEHGLTRLQEPARPDRFVDSAGPVIHKITVEKVEQDRG